MNSPSCSDLTSDLSSDLSSIGSLSPPPEYLTPPSSQSTKPLAEPRLSQKRPADGDETLPTKKRKTIEPKPRTTQYLKLGLSAHSLATDQKVQLDTLLNALRKRQRIVVVAGAGISVSAGSMYRTLPLCIPMGLLILVVPDFRSDTGLFKTLREEHKLKASGKHLFDASVYQTDASTSSFHNMVRSLSEQATAAQPTEFHHMLAKLASDGRLHRLYTQNVDGIETSMPPLTTKVPLSHKGPWPRTVQLHGGLEKMVCSKCHLISDFEPALFNGAEAPPCKACVETDKIRTNHAGKRSHGIGRLRPRIVLYNEHNPDQEAIGAVMEADLKIRADAVIVVGTSMKIPGVRRFVREMCGLVRDRKDGLAVWINRDPAPPGKEFENCWDLVVEGDCDQVAAHANMKRWDDTSVDYQECSESDVERAKAKNSEVKVIVETAATKAVKSALLTPAPSPRSKSAEVEQSKKMFPKLNVPEPLNFHLDGRDSKPKGLSNKPAKPTTKPKGAASRPAKAAKNKTTCIKTTKASKAKATKTKKAVIVTVPNVKISDKFKVSKQQAPRYDKPKQVRLTPEADEPFPRAMAPLSPSAARINGPIVLVENASSIKSVFEDLPSPRPSIENIHLAVTKDQDWRSPPKQRFSVVKVAFHDFEGRTEYFTPIVPASKLGEEQIQRSTGRLKQMKEETVSPPSKPKSLRELIS